jgi:acetyl-CoA carboxylase biotin carboxyl carrier protein
MDLPRYLKDLQALLDLMRRNELAEIEIEEEGQRVRLRKTEPRVAATPLAYAAPPHAPAASASSPASPASSTESPAPEPADNLQVVKSPLVGTFYRAASPESDPFVQDGDRVEVESVLCIVEAMKVMNEITAGVAGIVKEILVKNGEPVEFGQPLFRIETV